MSLVKILIPRLGRLLCLSILFAGVDIPAQPATAAVKHSLWKLQGKQNTVYLLGSVHVLKKENYPLPKPIDLAFSNASVVAFETEIDKLESPDLAMKLALKGVLPDGQTLAEQLSPQVYAGFSNHVQKAGVPVQIFDTFTPAMAALTLVAIELKKMQLDSEFGLDKHFFELARQAGKKIVSFETVDFQINMMTSFSKEEGELLMKTTLRDIDVMQNDLNELLHAWQTGNATKLEKLLNEAKADAPVIFKRLVTDRNLAWVPKIEDLARQKENAIVIVGAGHLVGPQGIVELLRKKNYKITQQ